MTPCTQHYQKLLGPVYVWMVGGVESALQAGTEEIDAWGRLIKPGVLVVDLGAGFGMHAIPLAQRGVEVIAIDSSAELMRTLAELAHGLAIRGVVEDLTTFVKHLDREPQMVLCMGDTITHLTSLQSVDDLIRQVAQVLERGGLFVLTFRDYTTLVSGDSRFIPVRADDSRILTCFLEASGDLVEVYDILHERNGEAWSMRVSHYPKLRIAPDEMVRLLENHGFRVRREAAARGMVRLLCEKM